MPPSRKDIDAELFGLTAMGDGATICKYPLTNVLFAGGYEHQALIDVIDSSDHMAAGGVKDARYIASKIMPLMENIDPKKELFDMVVFNGAANVQKAGRVIAVRFPKVIVCKGTEQIGSLFLTKAFKEAPLELLKTWTSILRNIFGSTRHAEHAMFRQCAKEHTKGVLVSFTRVAGTRMCGHLIAALRLLRLKPALLACVHTPEFLRAKSIIWLWLH
mmetsp:Transcript_4529/g.9435  ORF Transcript_4529/g.9435 Transcript_4529/m.9435 type:complete len:217 (-) Transcript_4529:1547-2197(-)